MNKTPRVLKLPGIRVKAPKNFCIHMYAPGTGGLSGFLFCQLIVHQSIIPLCTP